MASVPHLLVARDAVFFASVAAALPVGVGVARAGRRLADRELPVHALWILIGAAAVAVSSALAGAPTSIAPFSLALGWILLALALVDAATSRLPNILTLPLVALGLLATLWMPAETLLDHVLGAAAGYGVFLGLALLYHRLRGQEGLGLGDAKLMGAAGAWLGWRPLPTVILLGCVGAFLWLAIRAVTKGRDSWREPLPFGPPLCAAIWLVWLYGPGLSAW